MRETRLSICTSLAVYHISMDINTGARSGLRLLGYKVRMVKGRWKLSLPVILVFCDCWQKSGFLSAGGDRNDDFIFDK